MVKRWRRRLRILPPRIALAACAAVVLVGVALPGTASATPTWANSCDTDLDVGSCERLTYLAEQSDALNGAVAAIAAQQATDATVLTEQQHRLDLIWWGAWALIGLTFVSLVAALWFRSWGIAGKLGHG